VNIAEGENRFRAKPLLDEKGVTISKIKGTNEMAYSVER